MMPITVANTAAELPTIGTAQDDKVLRALQKQRTVRTDSLTGEGLSSSTNGSDSLSMSPSGDCDTPKKMMTDEL